MIINDIWGRIKIEDKYEQIINSNEFISLKNKTQLGLNCSSNATHTRYQHSIGTYFLACRLIEVCKSKFSEILNITKEDEEAIKCMALVHDIGHGCFSHVSEKYLNGTHEDRTELILLDKDSEIHKAIISSLGEKVLNKTIYLLKLKEIIKEKGEVDNGKDLMLIIGKLLSGGIDIDRIDYILRDSKNVVGENNDFSAILDSIDLECIDGSLEVVFDQEAEFRISNFFNKRFELYDTIYFDSNTLLIEKVFGKFLERTGIKLSWETTEVEMNNIFREQLNSSDSIIKRYASILNSRKLDNSFIIKEMDNKESYDFFCKSLVSKIPELKHYEECLFQANSKVSIYNKDNKVFINKSGLIQDISESSKILNLDLYKENYIVAIDINLLELQLEQSGYSKEDILNIIEKIKKAMSVEIEQEKKYIFDNNNNREELQEKFEIIAKELQLKNPTLITNYDTYFDCNDILESKRIALRKREVNGNTEWTLKRPLSDKSSVSKRDEKNFLNQEEVLNFLQNEWNINISKLEEKVKLKTERAKYDLEYSGGIYEISFDITTSYQESQKIDTYYMLECELKEGNSAGLYLIDEIIKKFPFIKECNNSKKEIALQKLNNKNKILEPFSQKVKYDKEISTFFIGNPTLFENLKLLDEKKNQIKAIREKYGDLKTPLVVTISGTPRAGKTTCVENLAEFLKKCDLRTLIIDEPAGLIYKGLKNSNDKKKLLQDRVGFVDKQYEVGTNAILENIKDNDVLICDRGNIDPFVWYNMYYNLGMMDEQRYLEFLSKLSNKTEYCEQFFALYASSDISMHRDYINSLSIEPRTTMNKDNIERYNNALLNIYELIEKEKDNARLIDTTNCERMDASIIVANDVLERVRKLF